MTPVYWPISRPRKLSLDPADPELDRLSLAIQQLVQTISHKAAAELELAAEIGEAEAAKREL